MISFYFLFYLKEFFVSKFLILLISRNLVISTSVWLWHSPHEYCHGPSNGAFSFHLWPLWYNFTNTCRPASKICEMHEVFSRATPWSMLSFWCQIKSRLWPWDAVIISQPKIICHGVYMLKKIHKKNVGTILWFLHFFFKITVFIEIVC